MSRAFADTSFFVAYLNANDRHHARAVGHLLGHPGGIVTTEWVLAELGNYLAQGTGRHRFAPLVAALMADSRFTIEAAGHSMFMAGLELYGRRADKSWSMVDCISFEFMRGRGIPDALTADRHFTQAGFRALLLE